MLRVNPKQKKWAQSFPLLILFIFPLLILNDMNRYQRPYLVYETSLPSITATFILAILRE